MELCEEEQWQAVKRRVRTPPLIPHCEEEGQDTSPNSPLTHSSSPSHPPYPPSQAPPAQLAPPARLARLARPAQPARQVIITTQPTLPPGLLHTPRCVANPPPHPSPTLPPLAGATGATGATGTLPAGSKMQCRLGARGSSICGTNKAARLVGPPMNPTPRLDHQLTQTRLPFRPVRSHHRHLASHRHHKRRGPNCLQYHYCSSSCHRQFRLLPNSHLSRWPNRDG